MKFKYQADGAHLTERELLFFNLCLNNRSGEVRKFINEGINVNIRNSLGWTPIMSAASHGYFDIVKMLSDNGAHLNVFEGVCGESVLETAVHNYGEYKIVKYLLDKNEIDVNYIDNNKNTALTLAVSNCNRKVSKLLLEYGANPKLINNKAQKLAKKYGLEDLYSLILKYKENF